MKRSKQDNKRIGNYGEAIAAQYLESKGFRILERNYLKKWGEIDIVAEKSGKIHFVEVKTVSYETKLVMESFVSRGTWKPEDNVHPYKVRKLQRAIESWLLERNFHGDWLIDVVAVKVVPVEKYASVKFIPNVIL